MFKPQTEFQPLKDTINNSAPPRHNNLISNYQPSTLSSDPSFGLGHSQIPNSPFSPQVPSNIPFSQPSYLTKSPNHASPIYTNQTSIHAMPVLQNQPNMPNPQLHPYQIPGLAFPLQSSAVPNVPYKPPDDLPSYASHKQKHMQPERTSTDHNILDERPISQKSLNPDNLSFTPAQEQSFKDKFRSLLQDIEMSTLSEGEESLEGK